ncbi:hypothetical protein GCM10010435_22350 [Winogradskya consettensis]|uniref:Uncharacterized protein n=1 Tax=Winogradskya consettensis TaxID=113560 RepID=A0A919T2E2_9ACTN|nr:hypothetical protein [Actinoplanes consettensis]GIM85203.1 hypothetical protein Aco04nite_95060 [Actinoplanes consettensis]
MARAATPPGSTAAACRSPRPTRPPTCWTSPATIWRPAESLPAPERILLASTHGFATGLEHQLDDLRVADPTTYDAALDLLARTATEPSLLGTAGHLLYIGRTPS